jgi:hypothetical protein
MLAVLAAQRRTLRALRNVCGSLQSLRVFASQNISSLDVCPFCDTSKELTYYSTRPTIAACKSLIQDAEPLVVRLDDLNILRTMVENAEFYESRVTEALAQSFDAVLLQQLFQAGKALEIEIPAVAMFGDRVKQAEVETWKRRVG